MNEALHHIRKALVTSLTDHVTLDGGSNYVSVGNIIKDTIDEPYIRIFSFSSTEADQNASSFNLECTTRIEVTTSSKYNSGGQLDCNKIVDQILNRVRTRSSGYLDLSSDNFNVYVTTAPTVVYEEANLDERSYFRAEIDLVHKVEKI